MALDATDRGCFCLACGAFAPEYPASGACPKCGRPMLKREARKRLELGRAEVEGVPLPAEVQEASKDPRNLFATKYVLLRKVGSGGMGFVWKAWELPLSRYVAIKFLKAPSPDDIARFEREARLAAALDHPNIIPIYDFGRAEGQFYLTMRYIDGTSLEAAELDEQRLIQVMMSVCRAVHSAHEAGVIHRDLKPANVMLSAEGRPMVLDFGLAKTVEGSVDVSVSGMVMGTPSYMAPEQAMGHKDRIDRRSDVYGLGAILYDMVAGRPPFGADAPMEILMKVVNDDLVPPRKHNPRISGPLETIILKALEKNPAHRYSSAAELADDLERLAAGQSIVARPSPRRWIPRVIRRNPLVVGALVLIVIAFALLARSRSPEAAPRVPARLAEAERRLSDLRELEQTSTPEVVLERCKEAAAAVQGTLHEVEWDKIRRSAFRKCWTAHASAGRFHSARASVADLGSFLNEDERKDVLAKIDENSRAAARTFHTNLLKMLPPQNTWESFIRGSSEEIESGLALPNAGELDAADEELKWARRCREQLLQARGRTDLPTAAFNEFLDALVRTAETCVQAAGRLRDAKDRAFPGLEALIHDLARGRLEKTLAGALDDGPEGRERRRNEAQQILEKMKDFAAELDKDPAGRPPVVSAHLEQLRSKADELPIDPPRLDKMGRQLLDPTDPNGLWGRKSELALKFEKELKDLDDARLSRDAQRKLCTYLLVSGTSRLLVDGEKADDIAQRKELKELAHRLEVVGGPLPEVLELVSPRIRAVVDRLKS